MANPSQWQQFQQRFDAFSQREKVMVFSAGLVLLLMVGFTFVIEPQLKHNDKTAIAINTASINLNSLRLQEQAYSDALAEDPDKELKDQLLALQQRLTALENEFSKELAELVDPAQMPLLIERVFASAEGLTLEEMHSVEPINIFAGKEEMTDVPLYQHGMVLKFKGDFFAVRDFLSAIEQLTSQIYWRSMTYQVVEYPIAEVSIEVYTLSTDKAFIRVN